MTHPFEKLKSLSMPKLSVPKPSTPNAPKHTSSKQDVPSPAVVSKPLEKPKAAIKKPQRPPFLDVLVKRFPLAFNLSDRKPLKIGIDQDILAAFAGDPTCSKNSLKKALLYYVMGRSYLLATVSSNERIDLEGNVAGEISLEERRHAEKSLAVWDNRLAPTTTPIDIDK